MKREAWVALLAAVVVAGATARLGVWQLDRAAQKVALRQSVESQRKKPALRADELPRDAAAVTAELQRPVELEGRWLTEATVLLDNRALEGRSGLIVVTPLLLADGRAVAVQRGWVPRHREDRTRIADFQTPAGQVRISGRLTASVPRLFDLGASAAGTIRQNLDLDAYAREFGLRLLPLSVLQFDDPAALSDGLLRRWPEPAVELHRHYGYAFQWFAICGLVIVLYVWFGIVSPLRRSRDTRRDAR